MADHHDSGGKHERDTLNLELKQKFRILRARSAESNHGTKADAKVFSQIQTHLRNLMRTWTLTREDDMTTACGFKSQEQQIFIQQHLESRDRSQVVFQGLAKKNGNLMEQAGYFGPNERKHYETSAPEAKAATSSQALPAARLKIATPAETRGLKRRADPNEMTGRKKGPVPPSTRPRSMSPLSMNNGWNNRYHIEAPPLVYNKYLFGDATLATATAQKDTASPKNTKGTKDSKIPSISRQKGDLKFSAIPDVEDAMDVKAATDVEGARDTTIQDPGLVTTPVAGKE
ncbi:MAG: hypothetical protein J3Q66DRAFT_398767 [Benniella sp.]|nr:MAG: hypothetical protein J3Q66DRAFT_398767 [Benniella sp.]